MILEEAKGRSDRKSSREKTKDDFDCKESKQRDLGGAGDRPRRRGDPNEDDIGQYGNGGGHIKRPVTDNSKKADGAPSLTIETATSNLRSQQRLGEG